jgi:hypothetical protein
VLSFGAQRHLIVSGGDKMASMHKQALQRQTQQDWENRADVEVITSSIKKIADFLNSFGK